MSNDFYIAFITGWFILFIFWSTIIIFVYFRKPPNSKLTKKNTVFSYIIFLIILLVIIFLNYADSFFLFLNQFKFTTSSS